MADSKITALTALTAADPVNDMFPVVDVSDTSMAASGTTKRISANNILGASGTATLASATITGAATVGTTLGVTGVSTLASAVVTGALTAGTTTLVAHAAGYTGKVGIGTATPSQPLHVKLDQNAYTFSRIDNQNASSGAYAALMLGASGNSWGIGVGSVAANSNALDFLLDAGGLNSVKMTLNTTGNLAFPTGKGIDFSAVTGGTGTATANVLNDYEEGTFTPTVIGTTTAGVGVYSNQTGYYTKVGRLVTITVYMNWTAHTGTGNMRFAGLPFTSANVATNYNGINIGYVNNIALTAGNVLYGLLEFGTTYVTVTQSPTGGGAYSLVPIDTSAEIAFSATYFV